MRQLLPRKFRRLERHYALIFVPKRFRDLVSGGTDYSFFGALVAVWVAKGLLLVFERTRTALRFSAFLAAKDERDASKLGALWGAIHTVRWCFAMAIAVMAIMGIGNAVLDAKLKADPETALPLIIGSMLPVGLVGFMLAALLSGFLATFSSTVNGGAAYLVKDVYQRYINPDADDKTLIRASYHFFRAFDHCRFDYFVFRNFDQHGVFVDFRNARRRNSAAECSALVLVASERARLRGGRFRRNDFVARTGFSRPDDFERTSAAALHRISGDCDSFDDCHDRRFAFDAADRHRNA